jgi:hypothetical protein
MLDFVHRMEARAGSAVSIREAGSSSPISAGSGSAAKRPLEGARRRVERQATDRMGYPATAGL